MSLKKERWTLHHSTHVLPKFHSYFPWYLMATASLLLLLLLAAAARSSATWCVCKQGVSDAVLQKTLDYACGSGADCNPIRQRGSCFSPNTVRAHCNYAVNSYFQRNRQAPLACDFTGTAAVVNSDPSTGGCAFPATASVTSTTAPTVTTPNGGSPLVTTPTTGASGGANNGLGFNNNLNVGIILVPKCILIYLLLILTIFGL
ncbi:PLASMODESMATA CALLOSE-BINDING PROTEIN 3-like [Salvia miltiorrhiza]|uniref:PLASMODESMATA CALLOSE-BINDING PROTEIN 3-like n=1 Tax=Salvia miltiorrhiza TaxID=226208 RepID=UPI0025AC520D|nr:PLASMODESMATA CALLOSE-BINDING PROTEIN 3-like [Salvia miltiorrhiza]